MRLERTIPVMTGGRFRSGLLPFLLMLLIGFQAAGRAPEDLHTLDCRGLKSLDLGQETNAVRVWEEMHLLSALQGIVNRGSPRLYLLYCSEFGVETDQFWLDWLRGEDGWLKKTRVIPLASVEEAVRVYRQYFDGLVVYDPAVPATSCLASTAAGCLELLPVRYSTASNSVFTLLTEKLKIPVRLWLVNRDGTSKFTGTGKLPDFDEPSSGSAKADAYRWAVKRFIETRAVDPHFAAYYLDSYWLKKPRSGPADLHTLSNHDYFIARRAFFFDLSPWGDEAPVDDPGQAMGLDKKVLLEVLAALNRQASNQIIKIGGFPPWPYKYTTAGNSGRHEGVPTEWEFTRIISQYSAYHEADAAAPGGMANASLFANYPLKERYPQPNRKPGRADWEKAGLLTPEGRPVAKLFVGHYVGDYDAPSWLYRAVPAFFADRQRGVVPMGWSFDPNLADRAPQVLAYAYRHATTNDFFIAGDSGAGYLNPVGLSQRPDSGLPPALEAWGAHCAKYYRRWDMTITGFVLDGSSGASGDREFSVYARFSPDGCGTHMERGPRMIRQIATCPERDLPDSEVEAARVIGRTAKSGAGKTGFLWARSILKTPSWYVNVQQSLREQFPDEAVVFVDPYTFFGLVGLSEAQKK
ncbi:MAG: GxGYxYP family putative glycoside hydrolase [Verrucomicrobia bacterium]|nr:GxGYxYP family putative glycoside hydrolase [Verrucomicrobiota bacterium]